MKLKLKILVFVAILALASFLRLYRLDSLLSPYWEEMALGYDAFSISQTGADHHGNAWPIVAFESFGDWKPSGYFYLLAPLIKILGLNVWAVRLPSALAGLSIVIGVFVLLKQILPSEFKKTHSYLPYLGMLIAAISPWAILFSRAAWEVNLATALITWGIIAFFAFIQSRQRSIWLFALSILLLAGSMYTYHATRLIAPLLGLALLVMWFLEDDHSARLIIGVKQFVTHNLILILLGLILSGTLLSPFLLAQSSVTGQRFKETSIFSDLKVIERSNEAMNRQPNILGKLFYHRYTLFSLEIGKNFLSHFNFSFLFLSGDGNVRHSTQYFGQLYHVEAFYLFFGLVFVATALRKIKENNYSANHKKYLIFLFVWLVIGILPASLTFATPHALRILPTLPVWLIVITLGIGQLLETVKELAPKSLQKLNLGGAILTMIVIAYTVELGMFWQHYTKIYPVAYANEWQFGYQEMIETVNENSDNSTAVYITREQGRPAMYYWFYSQTNPKFVQAADATSKQDQGEYLEFANVKFINSVGEIKTLPALVAASPAQIETLAKNQKLKLKLIKDINNPAEVVVWKVVTIE